MKKQGKHSLGAGAKKKIHPNRDLDIETMTCLALARLYDDPNPAHNHFDCGWDWRSFHQRKGDKDGDNRKLSK